MFPACRREIVERDQLEVAPVLESDERVVREAAGVLAAGRHGEAALAVIGDRNGEVEDDEHDVIEAPNHANPPDQRERSRRGEVDL